MHETHDLGPLFTHRVSLEPRSKRIHRAVTNELDEPYRRSNSLVVRLFHRYGLVFGFWRKTGRNEEQAIIEALAGYEVKDYDPENPYPSADPDITDEDLIRIYNGP